MKSNNDGLDTSGDLGNNKAQHDENEIHVNIKEQVPLNSPDCQHASIVRDRSEELGFAYTCQDCGLGWLLDSELSDYRGERI